MGLSSHRVISKLRGVSPLLCDCSHVSVCEVFNHITNSYVVC